MSKTTDWVIGKMEDDSKIHLQDSINIYRSATNKDKSSDKSYNYIKFIDFLKTLTIEEIKDIFIDMKNHYSSDDVRMLKAILLTAWQTMMEKEKEVYVLKVINVNKIIHLIKEIRSIHNFSLRKAKDIVDNISSSNPFIFHISEDHFDIIKAYERIKDFAECRIVKENKKSDIPDEIKEKTFMEELEGIDKTEEEIPF